MMSDTMPAETQLVKAHSSAIFLLAASLSASHAVCAAEYDKDGNTLPVFDVFHKFTRPIHRTDGQ